MIHHPRSRVLVVAAAIFALASTIAIALPSYPDHRIPYVGHLEDDGAPVDGTIAMTFRLFDAPVGGSELWNETRMDGDAVRVSSGAFSVELGELNALPREVLEAPSLYLDVVVDGVSLGRQRIHAATHSVRASEGAGVVGIGSIIAHTTHLPGSFSVAEMQAQGFAVLDGTTPASQGITGAVITGTLPDLNGQGRFLRGGTASGTLEDDATSRNGLGLTDSGHNHVTMTADNCGNHNGTFSVGSYTFYTANIAGQKRVAAWDSNVNCASDHYATAVNTTGVALTNGDAETRPTNMRVIWMMRVR